MTDAALTEEELEDAAHEEHYFAVKKALRRVDAAEATSEMSEAMYAGSELGVLPFDGIDVESALEIWRAVESVRQHGFPTDLRM